MPLKSTCRPALFLDRDGVINKDYNYVHRIEDFHFIDGIFDLCRNAVQANMPIVVVTNQAGIARGYYNEAQFQDLTIWMCDRFSKENAPITRVYYCPYHPTCGIGLYKKDSYDRKPGPGMLFKARDELNLNLGMSAMVGDNISDMQAANSAGIPTKILLGYVGTVPQGMEIISVHTLTQARKYLFSDDD